MYRVEEQEQNCELSKIIFKVLCPGKSKKNLLFLKCIQIYDYIYVFHITLFVLFFVL